MENKKAEVEVVVEGLAKLSKEVKESVVHVTRNEARFLVDTYYQIQKMRLTSDNQIRAIANQFDEQSEEIPVALQWISANTRNQEEQIKKMLDVYTSSTPVGQWCKATKGIGPVLAAGCLSFFDIKKVNHYNQFWSYAGLNDYNNPWLGTEKANKIVKEIYTFLGNRDKELLKKIEMDKPKQIKEAKQLLKQYKTRPFYGADDKGALSTFRDAYPSAYIVLQEELSDNDIIEDFVIRNFIEANAVTENVIVELMKRVKRTRPVIINGLNNALKTKQKKNVLEGQWDKSDLSSYLAKPPYNMQAKQLVYLLGESFVKVANRGSLYGRIYAERKAFEIIENEKGAYSELAEKALTNKNFGKGTESYKAYIEGKLPAAQIYARAKRHAVQLFLSHLYEAMYMDFHKKAVPHEIYPIAYQGHADYIGPEVPFEDYITLD